MQSGRRLPRGRSMQRTRRFAKESLFRLAELYRNSANPAPGRDEPGPGAAFLTPCDAGASGQR